MIRRLHVRAQNGVPDGQGTLRQHDGTVRAGLWRRGQLVHGSVRGGGDTVHISDARVLTGTFRPRPLGSQTLLWALGIASWGQVCVAHGRARARVTVACERVRATTNRPLTTQVVLAYILAWQLFAASSWWWCAAVIVHTLGASVGVGAVLAVLRLQVRLHAGRGCTALHCLMMPPPPPPCPTSTNLAPQTRGGGVAKSLKPGTTDREGGVGL